MSSIEIKDLTVSYGETDFHAVKDLNITVKPNEFLCIIGPSGCGKTTILNTIAGFVKPKTGMILNKNLIRKKGTPLSIVFQDHNLFPWKTAAENIGFGPKMKGVEKNKREDIVKELINLTKLEGFEDKYPNELSGGMQQRVGIARALANKPSILLMDEPFGSLDAQTRMQMQELLLSIWEREKNTIIFVTHEIDEAILLADRVIVLTESPGKVKKEILIDLPRPRNHKMTVTRKFSEIKKEILRLLREEINSH